MTISDAIQKWKARNEALNNRLIDTLNGMSDETLNRKPDSDTWSPAQVVEHLVRAHRPYLETMEAAIPRAPEAIGDPEVRYSFFGKLIAGSVGPGGKAPVPKKLHPTESPNPREVIDEWQQQQKRILELIDRAAGKDLSRTPVRNPFYHFIRMNLADCFEILTTHTERHMLQIEERVSRPAVEGDHGAA